MSSNLADFGGLELDDLDDLEKEVASATSSEFAKLTAGKNLVRFLPPKKKGANPFKIIHIHYIRLKRGGEEKTVSFVCPRLMTKGKERCPACEMQDKLKKGNSVDKEKSDGFKPTMRVHANVIMRAVEEEGPKILAFGKKIFDALKSIRRDKDDGGDFTDPSDEGFDIIINKEGEMRETRYEIRARQRFSALAKDEDQAIEWVDNQWPLVEYAVLNEFTHNFALMTGKDPREMSRADRKALRSGADDDDEDNGERRSKKKNKKRASRSAQDEIDEDDDGGKVIDVEAIEHDDDDDDIQY